VVVVEEVVVVVNSIVLNPYIFKGAVITFNFVFSPFFGSIDEIDAVDWFSFGRFCFYSRGR
jgi:hypothetical protein